MKYRSDKLAEDADRLGSLAMRFRGTRVYAERRDIAKEYALTVRRLIESGQWDEAPSPEDQLPHDWMPPEFFEYWTRSMPGVGAMEVKAAKRIKGSEKLISIFGYWPSFHDAEVLTMSLDRRRKGEGFGPTLDARVHAFEISNEISPDGYHVLQHHVLVDLRFHDVDVLELTGFNHQNALYGLEITDLRERQLDNIEFGVHFAESFGVEARFLCRLVEVLAVTQCREDGSHEGDETEFELSP